MRKSLRKNWFRTPVTGRGHAVSRGSPLFFRSPQERQLLPCTGLTLVFFRHFGLGLWLTFPLILSLAMLVILLGQDLGRREGSSPFESFYWSFITATTVGYGDIQPVKRALRICAILIAFLGLTLTGIVIAVAVQAATLALNTSRSLT